MTHGRASIPDGVDGFGDPAFSDPWPEIDASLLQDARGPVPAFPLDVLSPSWRHWVDETAQAVGAPVDYVAQSLFGAVAGVTGAGVIARITPTWLEPMVLWQALVGLPSSGKSPALAAMRGHLADIEEGLRAGDEERRRRHEQGLLLAERWRNECADAIEVGLPPPERPAGAIDEGAFVPTQIVVADATIEALADVANGNPRGVILWRDELTAWLANLGRYANGGSDRAHWLEAWAAAGVTINRRSRSLPMHLKKFPVSVIGSIQPDRLAEALAGGDDGMAARFLYAWPDVPPFQPLGERPIPAEDTAWVLLDAIAAYAGTPESPLVLNFEPDTIAPFSDFLADLHEHAQHAEGLEAGWLGKGKGTVARLAAILTLLAHSEDGVPGPPRTIGRKMLDDAIELWGSYFRPHAQTVFNRAGRTDRDRHARKAARWLKTARLDEVAREDIRRCALSQIIPAEEVDGVIARLADGGILRLCYSGTTPRGGRPVRRWQVNPAL